MALGWNTLRALPSLKTYKEASDWEKAVKPIRGRKPEVKPLGQRNQTYISIAREEDESIVLSYCEQVFARYRPNGDVLLYDHSYWNKASHNDMIGEITGLKTETFDRKMWVHIGNEKFYIRPSKRPTWTWETAPDGVTQVRVMTPDTAPPENIFRREKVEGSSYERWVYVNPPTLTRHLVVRKEMTRVRKMYQPFVQYAEAMDKVLGGEMPSMQEYARVFELTEKNIPDLRWYQIRYLLPATPFSHEFNHEDATVLSALMLSENLEDQYTAFLWLCADASRPKAKHVERVMIMAHHYEVLKPVESETTNKTKDLYAWAIPKKH